MLLEFILPTKWVNNSFFQISLSLLTLYIIREVGPLFFKELLFFIIHIIKFILQCFHQLFICLPFQLMEMISDSLFRARKRELELLYFYSEISDDQLIRMLSYDAFTHQRDIKYFKEQRKLLVDYLISKHGEVKNVDVIIDNKSAKPNFFWFETNQKRCNYLPDQTLNLMYSLMLNDLWG